MSPPSFFLFLSLSLSYLSPFVFLSPALIVFLSPALCLSIPLSFYLQRSGGQAGFGVRLCASTESEAVRRLSGLGCSEFGVRLCASTDSEAVRRLCPSEFGVGLLGLGVRLGASTDSDAVRRFCLSLGVRLAASTEVRRLSGLGVWLGASTERDAVRRLSCSQSQPASGLARVILHEKGMKLSFFGKLPHSVFFTSNIQEFMH